MTVDLIEKFVESKGHHNSAVAIHFRQRDSITGLFVRGNDYEELKSKNFWRVVSRTRMEEWKKTGDIGLSRIFNGAEFTRLADGLKKV